jgi:hypothetical protein
MKTNGSAEEQKKAKVSIGGKAHVPAAHATTYTIQQALPTQVSSTRQEQQAVATKHELLSE